MGIRQSFCYGCFVRDCVTLETVIKEAATIGYAAVRVAGCYRQSWANRRKRSEPRYPPTTPGEPGSRLSLPCR